jgi:hypothetical protein
MPHAWFTHDFEPIVLTSRPSLASLHAGAHLPASPAQRMWRRVSPLAQLHCSRAFTTVGTHTTAKDHKGPLYTRDWGRKEFHHLGKIGIPLPSRASETSWYPHSVTEDHSQAFLHFGAEPLCLLLQEVCPPPPPRLYLISHAGTLCKSVKQSVCWSSLLQ